MGMFRLETADEAITLADRLARETETCTCPDVPHVNRLHDLANDVGDVIRALVAEAGVSSRDEQSS